MRSRGKIPETTPAPPLLDQVHDLLSKNWGQTSIPHTLEDIDRAIEKRARDDLVGLVDDLTRLTVEFDFRWMVRVQWIANRYIHEWNQQLRTGPAPPPKVLVDHLAHIERVQEHVLRHAQGFAKARHVLVLADEAEHGRTGARKLREALRTLGHPVTPAFAEKNAKNEETEVEPKVEKRAAAV